MKSKALSPVTILSIVTVLKNSARSAPREKVRKSAKICSPSITQSVPRRNGLENKLSLTRFFKNAYAVINIGNIKYAPREFGSLSVLITRGRSGLSSMKNIGLTPRSSVYPTWVSISLGKKYCITPNRATKLAIITTVVNKNLEYFFALWLVPTR